MCKCLEIPRSLYYYHKQERLNKYKEANKILDAAILKIFKESKGRYGSPKIKKKLEEIGIIASLKRIRKRMKFLGLKCITIKKFNPNGNKKVDDTNKPNLLNQEFKADKPSEKWVSDITYIYTKQYGWTYLATVLDLFDLQVIGYEYGKRMTAELVVGAFNKAIINREPTENMIFHTDLGSQYTSDKFESLLKENRIKHSYSRKAYPYDNASMESFNAILKKEEVNVTSYQTYDDARLAIFEFIESWYNRERIHGTLNYLTPMKFYENYYKNLVA